MEPNDKYQQDPYGEAEQAAARRVLEGHALADAQALADVRTLDEWARRHGVDVPAPGIAGRDVCCIRLLGRDDYGASKFFGRFEGPTPDAARHAAAEWVRKEKLPSAAEKERTFSQAGDQSGTLPHASTIGSDERGTPLVFSTQCAVCSGPCQGHATQPSKGSE
jgi:hypothetical protein